MTYAPDSRWFLPALMALAAAAFTLTTHVRAQTAAPSGPAQIQTDGQAPPENLSERLDRDKGVIAPPRNVDPDMQVAPPDTSRNTMPVIPPPGSPGGDRQIQPK